MDQLSRFTDDLVLQYNAPGHIFKTVFDIYFDGRETGKVKKVNEDVCNFMITIWA